MLKWNDERNKCIETLIYSCKNKLISSVFLSTLHVNKLDRGVNDSSECFCCSCFYSDVDCYYYYGYDYSESRRVDKIMPVVYDQQIPDVSGAVEN